MSVEADKFVLMVDGNHGDQQIDGTRLHTTVNALLPQMRCLLPQIRRGFKVRHGQESLLDQAAFAAESAAENLETHGFANRRFRIVDDFDDLLFNADRP